MDNIVDILEWWKNYFVKQLCSLASRVVAQNLKYAEYVNCKSISCAFAKIKIRNNTWQMLRRDVTHYGDRYYLTLIDWSLEHLATFFPARHCKCPTLLLIYLFFFERGLPVMLFIVNDIVFYKRFFKILWISRVCYMFCWEMKV